MSREPKVKPQIVLGKVAAAAEHFAELNQWTRGDAHAGVKSHTIAPHPLQLKADPGG